MQHHATVSLIRNLPHPFFFCYKLKEELIREKELRSSLEESHTSLLQRVSDMERIVESERGDVQMLAQDCQTLKREAVSAREECEKAQRLKGQLEALVTQLQEDAGTVYVVSNTCTSTEGHSEESCT